MTQPYVIAVCITAFTTIIVAIGNWHSSHKMRSEGHSDSEKILSILERHDTRFDQIDLKFERADTQFERIDLRLDSIEDKVERHLGWHRADAEKGLEKLLKRDSAPEIDS